ncbi:MAG: hypothetical protein AAGI90_04685, partial [Chlamydiota bacterium]
MTQHAKAKTVIVVSTGNKKADPKVTKKLKLGVWSQIVVVYTMPTYQRRRIYGTNITWERPH